MWHTLITLVLSTFWKKSENFNKNNITNIFRIQAYDSIMCGYIWIGFIGFLFEGRHLTDFTNFLPHSFEKNDKVIVKLCFEIKYKHEWTTCVCHQTNLSPVR